jgi:hypothetical protein
LAIIVTSPYTDDETRDKEVAKIIEEYIENQWAVTGVASSEVAFGKFGDELLQTGKDITLRAYSIFEDLRRMTVNGSRWVYTETIVIDIYVLNNEDNSARDQRATKIRKWLDGLFTIHQGDMPKGVYEIDYRGARPESDPFTTNLTRIKATLDVRYILDIVEI